MVRFLARMMIYHKILPLMFYCNTSYLGVAGGEFAVVKTGLCDYVATKPFHIEHSYSKIILISVHRTMLQCLLASVA